MKKSLLTLFTLVALFSSAVAQLNVTFRVDMSGQTVSPNGVFVAGNFQSLIGAGGDFLPGVTQMTDAGNGIYEFTANLPEYFLEYKFYNGNTEADAEVVPNANAYDPANGNTNRYAAVFTDSMLAPVRFSGSAPAGLELLELAVDLQFFTPSDFGVHVAGDFQSEAGFGGDWNPATTRLIDYFPADVNQIYSIQLYVPAGTYEYKFINGNTFNNAESVPAACGVGSTLNRTTTIAEGTPREILLCYSTCDVSCTSVSTGESLAESFSVFPVPAAEAVMVNTSAAPGSQISLTDLSGRTVAVYNVSGPQLSIARNNLAPGIYLLSLREAGKAPLSRKVVFE